MFSSSPTAPIIVYKIDDGEWFEYTPSVKLTVPAGGKIYLKGDNLGLSTNVINVSFSKQYAIGGYLTSLISSTDYDKLETVPNSAFWYCFSPSTSRLIKCDELITSNIKYAGSYAFQSFLGNTKITVLPEDLFCNVQNMEMGAFSGCFKNCTNLTKLPQTLFEKIPENIPDAVFSECFMGCTSLTELPEDLFQNVTTCDGYGVFSSCFSGCSNLLSTNEGLFGQITTLNGDECFRECFSGCSNLRSLNSGIFSKATNAAYYAFKQCFKGCENLSNLPNDIFSLITSAADSSFDCCFEGCKNLTTIPNLLFSKITSTNTQSFRGCFRGCSSLTIIPDGVFSSLKGVSGPNGFTFSSTFANCTSLLNTPNFKNITSVHSSYGFQDCFSGCSNLQVIYTPQISTWNENIFGNWVKGVYPNGKIYKSATLEIPEGNNGLPVGWEVLSY